MSRLLPERALTCMTTVRPLGNASLFLLLTAAIAACGDSATVLESADGGGAEASLDGAPATGSDGAAASDGDVADGSTGALDASVADGGPGDAFSPDTASIRRPFLVGSSMRSAPAMARRDWTRAVAKAADALDETTRQALAASWLKDGLEEHASIAAFARFTMHLLSVGAPPDFVARSQRASLDEIQHARACFAFAERYSGRASGPSPLVVHDAMGTMSLADIAELTAEEGCVGETLGAALAAEQLLVATDPETQTALRKIAADESRHAELAWGFVRWAALKGGRDVKQAITRGLERAITATLAAEIRSYEGVDPDAWHAYGRLTCAESRAVAVRAIREVVRPCALAVLEEATPYSAPSLRA